MICLLADDEQQYSLPKWRDLSISRMGMYDDLYSKLPSQGWMFVPIGDCKKKEPPVRSARSTLHIARSTLRLSASFGRAGVSPRESTRRATRTVVLW